MRFSTPANRSLLLEFASQAVTNSSCLHTLHIQRLLSSAEDGDKFSQALADHRINWLKSLTIASEEAWFEGGRDTCMAFLLTLIAR